VRYRAGLITRPKRVRFPLLQYLGREGLMEKQKRVAIYARVSTADQTCENQLLILRRYCETRGWTITREFIDHAISGSKKNRPSLHQLMEFAWPGNVDCVLVWRWDRFARSMSHLVEALDIFRERGVDFASHEERMDTTTSQGRLMFGVFASFSEFERNLIQERIHAGMARAYVCRTCSHQKHRAMVCAQCGCKSYTTNKQMGRTPLDPAKVSQIRALGGTASIRAIAARVGVSKSIVHKVLSTKGVEIVA
jgi:DNA invertase Pin-like site-specific DNA recombinase